MAKKKANDANPGPGPGRPTRFRAEYVEQAMKLCRLGATDREMADFFGVHERALYRWKSAHPEFRQALKEGKTLADANVADRLYMRAIGYSHQAVKIMAVGGQVQEVPYTEHYPPDTAACIFWLKNRRPDLWRDRVDPARDEDEGTPEPQAFTFTVVDGRTDG